MTMAPTLMRHLISTMSAVDVMQALPLSADHVV